MSPGLQNEKKGRLLHSDTINCRARNYADEENILDVSIISFFRKPVK